MNTSRLQRMTVREILDAIEEMKVRKRGETSMINRRIIEQNMRHMVHELARREGI